MQWPGAVPIHLPAPAPPPLLPAPASSTAFQVSSQVATGSRSAAASGYGIAGTTAGFPFASGERLSSKPHRSHVLSRCQSIFLPIAAPKRQNTQPRLARWQSARNEAVHSARSHVHASQPPGRLHPSTPTSTPYPRPHAAFGTAAGASYGYGARHHHHRANNAAAFSSVVADTYIAGEACLLRRTSAHALPPMRFGRCASADALRLMLLRIRFLAEASTVAGSPWACAGTAPCIHTHFSVDTWTKESSSINPLPPAGP